MQSVSSRIWTCVAMSISYDDNHYTTVDYIKADLIIEIQIKGKSILSIALPARGNAYKLILSIPAPSS